jgi:uncharacterized protein
MIRSPSPRRSVAVAETIRGRRISIEVDGARTVTGILEVPREAAACYVVAHGAGAGMEHPFMAAIADGLHARGVATLRYQFPYMEAGVKRPDRAPLAQATVRAAVHKTLELLPGLPLVGGGKSFGGRMTSQAQAERPLPGVRALAFLGFPLHSAKKPSSARAEHLAQVQVPMLFLQGTRDALAEMPLLTATVQQLGAHATLVSLDGADHAFHVRAKSGRSAGRILHEALDAMVAWMEGVLRSGGDLHVRRHGTPGSCRTQPMTGTRATGQPFNHPSATWRYEHMEDEVRKLLVEQLKDAYSAEKQALRCMQRTLKKATAPALRDGIQMHIEQTQTQIERVEEALEKLDARPGRKVCEAMRGLVDEAQHELEEHDKGPILDLVIVAGMQRIEHYEIAAYGTDVALAKALGEGEVADLLTQTLEEEKQTDLKLTEVTEQHLMPEALGGTGAEDQPRAGAKTGGGAKRRSA